MLWLNALADWMLWLNALAECSGGILAESNYALWPDVMRLLSDCRYSRIGIASYFAVLIALAVFSENVSKTASYVSLLRITQLAVFISLPLSPLIDLQTLCLVPGLAAIR